MSMEAILAVLEWPIGLGGQWQRLRRAEAEYLAAEDVGAVHAADVQRLDHHAERQAELAAQARADMTSTSRIQEETSP
jgi:hypothetical protein